jgi:hypothetical protein
MSQHSEQREAKTLITDRVDNLNQCLNIICNGRVEAIPTLALEWKIVPSYKWASIPSKCNGLELEFFEDISAVNINSEIKLICRKFKYKFEAKNNVTYHSQRIIKPGWQFRYELDDKGSAHSFMNACSYSALVSSTTTRFPPYHLHVDEIPEVGDSLHYPLDEPNEPLNVIYDIIRLIKDEFV